MNHLLAHLVAIAALVAGMVWLGPVLALVDWITAVLALCGPVLLLLYAYGHADTTRYVLGGYARIVRPTQSPIWYDTDHAKAARIAKTGILFSMLNGGLFTLVGAVQMLQNLDDPSVIGPALAVAILSLLYAALLSGFVFMPLVRFHASEARAISEKDEDETLFHSAWVLMLVSFTILGTFSTLMLIFGS